MSEAIRRTDRSNNAVMFEYPPPPRALFAPSVEEHVKIKAAQAKAVADAGERARREVFWGRARMCAGAGGWAFAGLSLFVALAVFHRQTDHHHFTVLNPAEHLQTVYDSTWDLPTSVREDLILATASQYVRACNSYTWAEAQNQYDYCATLSFGELRVGYDAAMNPKNDKSPQTMLGQFGWRRAETEMPVRTAPNAISVPYLATVWKPGSAPVCARMIVRLSYTEVSPRSIPIAIRRLYPTADILFFAAVQEKDPTPLPAASCRT